MTNSILFVHIEFFKIWIFLRYTIYLKEIRLFPFFRIRVSNSGLSLLVSSFSFQKFEHNNPLLSSHSSQQWSQVKWFLLVYSLKSIVLIYKWLFKWLLSWLNSDFSVYIIWNIGGISMLIWQYWQKSLKQLKQSPKI